MTIKILRPAGNLITIAQANQEPLSDLSYTAYYYNSGTASLSAAIIASCKADAKIKKSEVIIPAYACPDLISAAINANTSPVLVDLEPNSPNFSIEAVKQAINKNTVAIVAVRFFGLNGNIKLLSDIARKNKISLIEDSAQGFPVTEDDSYWCGDFIVLSFGRGKPINLLNGGAVLSKKPELIKLLPTPEPASETFIDKFKYFLKVLIYNQSLHPFIYGLITRLPGLTIGETIYKPLHNITSMLSYSKSLLVSNIKSYQRRKNIRHEYASTFKDINHPMLIDLPVSINDNLNDEQPLLRYPILILNHSVRNDIYEKLKPYGASLMYQKPLNKIAGVDKLIMNDDNYTNAASFSQHLLTLPTHDDVNRELIKKIGGIIKDHLQ